MHENQHKRQGSTIESVKMKPRKSRFHPDEKDDHDLFTYHLTFHIKVNHTSIRLCFLFLAVLINCAKKFGHNGIESTIILTKSMHQLHNPGIMRVTVKLPFSGTATPRSKIHSSELSSITDCLSTATYLIFCIAHGIFSFHLPRDFVKVRGQVH